MQPLPAGWRDGPLRCDWQEGAEWGRGREELRAHQGTRRGACESAAAEQRAGIGGTGEPARGHRRHPGEGKAAWGSLDCTVRSREAGDSERYRTAGARRATRRTGGIRAGGREAGAPHLRGGGGGAAAAHGGAEGARRRRRARSYAPEPLGMRAGGRPGRARPGPARQGGGGGCSGGWYSRGGAARGRHRPHPPAAAAARLLLCSCCSSCSPAERGGRRRRRRLPPFPASRLPRPVPLPLPLPGRRLLSAARVSHQTPRPQCSAVRAAGRRQPERGRALPRVSETARRRAYLAVAPRQLSASRLEGKAG